MFEYAIEVLEREKDSVNYLIPKELQPEFISELQKAILILEREGKE